MGRITGYTSPEGAVSYTYDANGNVLTVTDSHGTITRTYDALNRVLSYTDTYGKVIRYEYDAVGNLSKIIYPDNTAVFQNTDKKWCIVDMSGNVIVTDYASISAFSNGIALAQLGDSSSETIYIDVKNEQVLQTVTLP